MTTTASAPTLAELCGEGLDYRDLATRALRAMAAPWSWM